MPWVPDGELQLTPPVDAAGKRYARMGSFMPLFHPYVGDVAIWESPPVKSVPTNSWLSHFRGPWRAEGREEPQKGVAHYLSDKLAELDQARPATCAENRRKPAPSAGTRACPKRSG